MTRIFGQYVAWEMALLGAVEFLLSYVLIQAMITLFIHADSVGTLEPAADFLAAPLACTIALTAAMIGLYRHEVVVQRKRLLVNSGVAVVVAFPAILAVSELLDVTLTQTYLLWLAKLLAVWMGCLLTLRAVLGAAMRRNPPSRRVLVVGQGAHADRAAAAARRGELHASFSLAGALDTSSPLSALSPERLRGERIWGLIVASDSRDQMPVAELLRCKRSGIRVFDENQFWERHLGRVNLETVDLDWMVFADGSSPDRLEGAVRRLMDVIISLSLLLFTLPLMALVALMVKTDSVGPVFYRQERVGLQGKTFTLWKFRSMRIDAEAGGPPRWASQRDPRVTRVGGFIRAARIDELPQLFNVLRGEMGFIGPRPERPHFVEELARLIPFYKDRSSVKPGITGWAQVNFPYGASVEDARHKLSYDLYYVKNRTLLLDFLILASTVRVVLFQEGAR